MITLSRITKSYKLGNQNLEILKGIDLTIEDGDFVAIMGPSGSGKSTLMNIIGLLDVPTDGSYKFNSQEVARMSEDELAVLRRNEIGFIFQQFNLLSRMTATENVALPLLYSKKGNGFEFANDLLAKVGLHDRTSHKPNELSGGQQQRVAIARSLVNRPQMILADEPTGNLDSKSEKEVMQILKELNQSGITLVMVTHEEEVGRQANRLIRMRDGVIVSDERQVPFNSVNNKLEKQQEKIENHHRIKDFLTYFEQGYRTLVANKVRTLLSMLGVMIGVSAVVTILAIGKGAEVAIKSNLQSLGSNLLMVRQGSTSISGTVSSGGSANRILLTDASEIKDSIADVTRVSAVINDRVQVAYEAKNWSTSLQGNSASWADMHFSKPAVGRFFTDDEDKIRARVAVIGDTVQKELFGTKSAIGEMVKIDKVSFQVIGVLPQKGASGWRDQDDVVIVPVNTAMKRISGRTTIDYLEVEVNRPENMEAVQASIMSVLNTVHRIPLAKQEESFNVRNLADIQAAIEDTTKVISILLSSVAGISLLVGGIGIMNIMLVSVTERTREIGLRKAVGARAFDILSQFLSESVVISLFGGGFGIVLAWFIVLGITFFGSWSVVITVSSVLIAFLFSATVGIVFGVYPAKKAAKLNPIDALRSE